MQVPVTGRWVGALDSDGNHIEIAITFAEQKGELAGSIDVVGIKAIPLEAVAFDPPNLNFQFDSPVGLAKFTGEKVNNEFAGTIEFPEAASASASVGLRRMRSSRPIPFASRNRAAFPTGR